MELRILKILLIQLKVFAIGCIAAMSIFLFFAFRPGKAASDSNHKQSCYTKEKEDEDVKESFLIGNFFAHGTLNP